MPSRVHSLLLITIFIFFSVNTRGQDQEKNASFYFKTYSAYGFLTPGSSKGNASSPLVPDTSYFKVNKKGMGEGIRAGAGFGFVLKDYLSIGIDGEYFKGKSIKSNTGNHESNGITFQSKTTVNYSIIAIIPNVTFKTVSNSNLSIYNRLGIIFGLPVKMTEDYFYNLTIDDPSVQRVVVDNYSAEHTLKMAVGAQVTVGIQMNISGRVNGFLELTGYSLAFNRERYEEIKREKTVTITPNGSLDPILIENDNSKNIIEYTNDHNPIIMNTIAVGVGILISL